MKKLFLFTLVWVLVCTSTLIQAQETYSDDFHKNYTLSEVVVLSRHNIRAPLSEKGSVLDKITPHPWYSWSSKPTHLSLKGGVMETMMGQYFRQWIIKEGLFQDTSIPDTNEMRVYANSMQRTLATTHYFLSGFMPFANIPVAHQPAINTMDPVFTPQITHLDDEFCKKAFDEMAKMTGEEAEMHKVSDKAYYCVLRNVPNKLDGSYNALSKVIDIKKSIACRNGNICDFAGPDTIWLKLLDEPRTKGSLDLANTVADALVLQYYEERDDRKAAFSHRLTFNDWLRISKIKNFYGDILFTTPTVSRQIATPLLNEIAKELNKPARKFAFLCGHDSNIGSVLAALGVTDYSLPNTVETKTPIGSKLVFEKWVDNKGEYYIAVKLIYHSTQQIRQGQYEVNGNEPIVFPIQVGNLQANADGLYAFDDIIGLLMNRQ